MPESRGRQNLPEPDHEPESPPAAVIGILDRLLVAHRALHLGRRLRAQARPRLVVEVAGDARAGRQVHAVGDEVGVAVHRAANDDLSRRPPARRRRPSRRSPRDRCGHEAARDARVLGHVQLPAPRDQITVDGRVDGERLAGDAGGIADGTAEVDGVAGREQVPVDLTVHHDASRPREQVAVQAPVDLDRLARGVEVALAHLSARDGHQVPGPRPIGPPPVTALRRRRSPGPVPSRQCASFCFLPAAYAPLPPPPAQTVVRRAVEGGTSTVGTGRRPATGLHRAPRAFATGAAGTFTRHALATGPSRSLATAPGTCQGRAGTYQGKISRSRRACRRESGTLPAPGQTMV